jgi:predicted N-formylglutamate amidohydrolase
MQSETGHPAAQQASGGDAVIVENEAGASPYVLVVDHASHYLPARYGTLGLQEADLAAHIAWDPGALDTARIMARLLDAALVHSTVSRLVLDLNRDPSAPDSIVTTSEATRIPGNEDLGAEERAHRARTLYEPYHAALGGVVERRLAAGRATALVAVHSFTPVYRGVARPWPVGILFDQDRRIADPLIAALAADPALKVGINEPYGPWDRVYHTLDRHAQARGLASVMIEVRNDQIADAAGCEAWARRLAEGLDRIARDGAAGLFDATRAGGRAP